MLIDLQGGAFGGATLARLPLAGGAPRPILEAAADPSAADWAPDGENLALLLNDGDGDRIEYPRGKVIWRADTYLWDLRVAPGGDALAFCAYAGVFQQAVVILDRAGKVVARSGGWTLPLDTEVRPRGCAAWTPDGREVWFAATRSGRESGLYAPVPQRQGPAAPGRPRRAGPARHRPRRPRAPHPGEPAELDRGAVGGGRPRTLPPAPPLSPRDQFLVQWRADGRALYVGGLFVDTRRFWIDEVDLETGRRVRWKELSLSEPAAARLWNVTMTPDGRAYAYEVRTALSTLYLVEGLR